MDLADLPTVAEDRRQPLAIRRELFRRHRRSVGAEEEALDDHRPRARGPGDVLEDAVELHRRPVHELVIGLGARIQLAPDLALARIHPLQPAAHARLVEPGGIGDEHQLGAVEAELLLHLRDDADALVEIRHHGRLAVAAEGDVADRARQLRHLVELRLRRQPAVERVAEQPGQLGAELAEVHGRSASRRLAVHLAIDAIEVASLVRVQVHPDRQTARPPRYDRIDVHEVLEHPGVVLDDGPGVLDLDRRVCHGRETRRPAEGRNGRSGPTTRRRQHMGQTLRGSRDHPGPKESRSRTLCWLAACIGPPTCLISPAHDARPP